jgi:ATP-dependent exoDNAse (exonuclease V) beta subunit
MILNSTIHLSHSNTFVIYNASAGSGKTFALVKAYLKKILLQPQPDYYKHLLAITFTNKAVAEMKTRIIQTLVGFSSEKVPATARLMLNLIVEETPLNEVEVKMHSGNILKHLLHHYAQFSVETIDHFNHRLIRTFAKDLNLDTGFEVSLDVKQLISQAVDQLIDKAGDDDEITKILLEFALQKTDDDKSWDIAIDLRKAADLFTNENDAKHLEPLMEKSLEDFTTLRKKLKGATATLKKEIVQKANKVVDLFHEHQLDRTHFSGGYLFDFFHKITAGEFRLNYNTAWQNNMEEKPLYPSRVVGDKARIIDNLVSVFVEAFQKIKLDVNHYALLQNILKNLVPLATVSLVNQELQLIKKEENILPINEFNALIHSKIKDQPAPFIYERLGDRYRNFFIDEFQDTSALQWNNLIPLIDNAISQEYDSTASGSLLLVGDAKQSIYRWRGGLPEQFIGLCENENPFSASKKTYKTLDINYRSAREIIEFNNSFFSFISNYFGYQGHQDLYEIGNKQKAAAKESGYVKIEFIDAENKELLQGHYSQKTLETVTEVLALGYRKNDICVLTRKRKEGIVISEYLLENEIPVISEETLLLKNSSIVRCLVDILHLSMSPQNEEVKIQFLDFLHQHLSISEEKHTFFKSLIHQPLETLSQKLTEYLIDFKFEELQHLSLYESCEYSIEALGLNSKTDAFLTSFMDLIFNFSQRTEFGKNAFLSYWEIEKEKMSISESKGVDAIQVMTIHKAKGLEFPVVIFPYADLDIYKEIEATAWYPWHEDDFNELLISYSKNIADYSEAGSQMVEKRRNTLELDNLNLFYVAMTRAEEQLYIFANNEKPKDEPTTYNGFLKAFLESGGYWKEDTTIYSFGAVNKVSAEKVQNVIKYLEIPYVVSSPERHNISVVTSEIELVNKEALRSINIGNLLHDAMSVIKTSEDVEGVVVDLKFQLKDEPETFLDIKNRIVNIVQHPELNPLFQPSEKVLNERDIITHERILRPDRINIHKENSVTIIDYKTGSPKEQYEYQINSYAMALQDMGYRIKEKLLVYSNNDEIVIIKT